LIALKIAFQHFSEERIHLSNFVVETTQFHNKVPAVIYTGPPQSLQVTVVGTKNVPATYYSERWATNSNSLSTWG
jgi:hypothetical protein